MGITWKPASGNLPNTISGPSSNSSQFFYAPDRARWKQVASYAGTSETTIYIGGLYREGHAQRSDFMAPLHCRWQWGSRHLHPTKQWHE